MTTRRSTAAVEGLCHGEDPMLIAMFMHKGGTGKTTMTGHLGAMLARQGKRVVIIDGDPQRSLTTMFAEDKLAQPEEPDIDGEEESDEEGREEGGEVQEEGEALLLPALPRDRLRKPDAMPADVMHGIKTEWCKGKDNLYSVLLETVKNDDPNFVACPTPVNVDDYAGRLMLLPGSPKLSLFNFELERNADTLVAGQVYGAFRKAIVDMCKSPEVRAEYALVDLGPHNDKLHMMMASSCDAVQVVLNPCSFSTYSTFSMLYHELPRWIKWFKEFAPKHATGRFAFNQRFPRLLPFLASRYGMEKGYVKWSESNLFETIRQVIDGESIGIDDTSPLPAEVKALYVPCKQARGKPTMLVPFMRTLEFLPVAQETGRALFDLSGANLNDYYQNSTHEVNQDKLKKEIAYVTQQLGALARNVTLLRAYFVNKRRAEQERNAGGGGSGGGGGGSCRRGRQREGSTPPGPGSDRKGKRQRQAAEPADDDAAAVFAAAPQGGAGASRRKPAAPQRVQN